MTLAVSLLLASHFSQPLHSDTSSQSEALPRRGALGVPLAPIPADLASKNGLQSGQGLLAMQPVAGMTGDRAGIKLNDIVLAFNGVPVAPGKVAELVRNTPAGKTVTFDILRDGKKMQLQTVLTEKPRDPGNKNFEVVYSHVVSHGERMRTIITKPRKAGKHPTLFFIQGFSPISYDYTLATSDGSVSSLDGPLLFDFANSGFVTVRVEKPGVGDSEGGPFAPMDYITELDIYRQALKQLKSLPEVDSNNVFIFGHSMGGSFGPMVAAENPVKGLAIYGVASRTWFEYLLDTIRYQGLVGGNSFEDADEEVRQSSRVIAQVFLENRSPADVKKDFPKLAPLVDGLFPGGLFNGKSLDFWRQLGQINFPSYWTKCNARVLAAKGFSDFVVYEVDHKLIADIVNRAHPGWGKSVTVPDSDHLFHGWKTEPESMKNFQRGKYSPNFSRLMMKWIKDVMKETSGK
jgi:pimeloyl-ACP methyl ester carboxylesterase